MNMITKDVSIKVVQSKKHFLELLKLKNDEKYLSAKDKLKMIK